MEARLAKVEAHVDTLRTDLDRLHDELIAFREHVDRRFAEQQQFMDRKFSEIRKELSTSVRWLGGLIFANLTLTIGLLGKVWGLH